MSKTTHTPGPWRVEPQEREPVILAGLTPVAGMFALGQCPEDRAEETANARLMAAAPDLLAALRQALPLLMAYYRATTEGAATYRVAQAAIASAEGEQ